MRQRLLGRIALIGLGLVAAELGARAWLAAGGGPPGGPAAALRAAADEIAPTPSGPDPLPAGDEAAQANGALPKRRELPEPERDVLHPFSGWSGTRFQQRLADHARSFDGSEDERVDLLVTGGSVAVFFVRFASEDLEVLVGADPRFRGREVRIMNLSSGGLKQPQHLILLALALNSGWRPDAVIHIDGFNELALSAQNVEFGIEPFYPAFSLWGPMLAGLTNDPAAQGELCAARRLQEQAADLAQSFERWGLFRSAIAAELAWLRMRGLHAAFQAAQGRLTNAAAVQTAVPLPGPRGFTLGDPELLAACADTWEQSSLSMQALCAARGIAYVHVLQPTLHDAGSKPLTDDERASDSAPESWVWAVSEGYPLLRSKGASLRAAGVHFVDASQVFAGVETTLYHDACHFRLEGNVILCEFVAPEVLAALP